MPDNRLLSIVISIPGNSNYDICDNYRGISLSSALTKIHDIIILTKYHVVLATSDMQYVFNAGHSYAMCTLTLKEAIKYYEWNKLMSMLLLWMPVRLLIELSMINVSFY